MRRNLIDLTATLRRREAEAQALLQGVVEGVFAVDTQRNVRYLNSQAARMLGIEATAAVGCITDAGRGYLDGRWLHEEHEPGG